VAAAASPFVGRRSELDLLSELIGDGRAGGGVRAALVLGDAGIGKTRLLAEARSIDPPGLHLMVAGHEPEQRVPLAAARDMLATLIRVSDEGNRLADLLYGRRDAVEELHPLRVLEAAYRCLASAPAVLVTIDDLQWVGNLTLTLLHYVLRAAAADGQSLVVIAASRPCVAATDLAVSLRSELPVGRFCELPLQPLSREEGGDLLRVAAPQLTRAAAEEIWRTAAGSPFWMAALAAGDRAAADVADMIVARLAAVGADAATLMGLLAVAGRPMAPADAASVLGWPRPRVDAAAPELMDRGLVVRRAATLAPAHDLIRDVGARWMSTTERGQMHRRLVRWLEDDAGNDTDLLCEALEHRGRGGLAVLEPALRLARSARRHLLGSAELDQLARIANTAEPSSDAADLHEEIGDLALRLGNAALALHHSTAAMSGHRDPARRSRAAVRAARAAFALQRDGAAGELLDIAERAAVDPPLQVEITIQRALLLRWFEGDLPPARILTRQALDGARSLAGSMAGHPTPPAVHRAYVAALRAEFDARFQAEELDGLVELTAEMAAAAGGSGEEDLKAATSSGILLRQLGRFAEAESQFRRAWTESRMWFLPMIAVEAGYWLAATLATLGRLEEARSVVGDTAALASRVGTPVRMSVPWVRSAGHLLDISQGEWQRGLRGLATETRAEPDPHYRLLLRAWYATSAARLGVPTARGVVSAERAGGLHDAAAAPCVRCRREFALRLAEAAARVGDVETAAALLTECGDIPARSAVASFHLAWARALLARLDGHQEDAVAVLTALDAAAAGLGMAVERLWLRLDLAAALASTRRDDAVALLAETVPLAAVIGARTEERAALRGLRELGVRAWRRSGRTADPDTAHLTERELKIASLVAEGASNPEIADALFLSRKTVERHVSNVLAKLSATNRTQLAARLANPTHAEPATKGAGAHR
jgi:DNA-binding CsgD family transcriptional regulator/tetratricopeptide (TPR) repeat protein